MKSWVVFLAGGLFALALVVTCGGHGAGGSVGAAENAVWEYAELGYSGGIYTSLPAGVTVPAALAACSSTYCGLNAMGSDGWELILRDGSTYNFKRRK